MRKLEEEEQRQSERDKKRQTAVKQTRGRGRKNWKYVEKKKHNAISRNKRLKWRKDKLNMHRRKYGEWE